MKVFDCKAYDIVVILLLPNQSQFLIINDAGKDIKNAANYNAINLQTHELAYLPNSLQVKLA